jgi:hypothetical protein
MKTIAKDLLTAWRAELATELTAATAESARLHKEHAEYFTAAQKAEADWKAIDRELVSLTAPKRGAFRVTRDSLASALSMRMRWLEQERDNASRRQAAAHAALTEVRLKVEDLERAVKQIDQLLAPAEQEAAA